MAQIVVFCSGELNREVVVDETVFNKLCDKNNLEMILSWSFLQKQDQEQTIPTFKIRFRLCQISGDYITNLSRDFGRLIRLFCFLSIEDLCQGIHNKKDWKCAGEKISPFSSLQIILERNDLWGEITLTLVLIISRNEVIAGLSWILYYSWIFRFIQHTHLV